MSLRLNRPWAGTVLVSFLLCGRGAAAQPAPAAQSPQIPQSLARRLQQEQGELRRYDQPDKALEHYRRKRAPVGEAAIPVERYLVALEHMAKMPQYSSARRTVLPSRVELRQKGISYAVDAAVLGAWTWLGPGNVGGRTRALVVHPTSPQTMYAGGAAGGVWKTVDGGGNWFPLGDLLPNLAVNTLALDRLNPNILYAGTGEGFSNVDALRGAGVFKTVNGGASWTHLASTRNANFSFVNDVVVSPKSSQRIYAATGTGVWRSLNGGVSWTRILNAQVNGGCLDLVIRTDQTTDFLFAACGTNAQGTVYRNTKAESAGSWSVVLREPGMGRTSLSIAPSNQKVIYALAASIQPGNFQDGLHGVFRSTTGGAAGSWMAQVRNTSANPLSTLLLTNAAFAVCVDEPVFFNQGWYDNVIAVDPKDPNRVWAGGIDLFRSDDGGRNWGLASYWWDDSVPAYAHADQHAIAFHPSYNGTTNKTMFVGSDGGVFRTANARAATAKTLAGACTSAATPFTSQNLNNGYGVTQFYHGVALPDGLSYFGGTQDNGTVLGDDFSGPNEWEESLGGDGGYVAVDPDDTNVRYAENPNLSIQKSVDAGANWDLAVEGITEDSENFLFTTPFTIDATDPQRLWTGAFALWRTIDGATSWTQASGLVAGDESSVVSAIAVDPQNGNHVLAGTSGGYIHRTTSALTSTGGTAWPFTRPRDGFVSSLAIDAADPNLAYATYSNFGGGHVWKTTDGGATWTTIDGVGAGRLPDIPVHSIVVDPLFFNILYAGTDLGVFITLDSGQTWMVENTGFANVVTESLQVLTTNDETWLYAFTHGRGAWRIQLD
ncbi:MAG TPA: hypothetical protein VKM72_15690 [Thermoanaerobaculia bacterium]|nr:hypothetical protein [Thermoanaerobaculia bacterium]